MVGASRSMESKPSSLDALRIDRSRAPLESGRGARGWIILVLLLLAGGGTWWWVQREKPVAVKTAVARAQGGASSSARTLLNASGYVTTRLDATVSSKVTGKVAEIMVEEGMKVEKGQVLARLDASNVETGLHLAEARLESAQRALGEGEPALRYAEAELGRLKGLEQ